MKVVFATDNGKTFMGRHFGDAKYYDIYKIDENKSDFIKRISNTTEDDDESIHADPKKAKGVADLFKDEDIKVLVSKVYGPNIKRMKKKFVCVISKSDTINDSIIQLQKKLIEIRSEWNKGESRNHLTLK